jgi:hypothetical protein
MAFCTKCGASVAGAFCNQCGTPAGAQTGAPTAAAAQAPAPAAAAPRKTSPVVWILVIVLGIFVLGFIGLAGTGLFVWHKVKQAGVDPELWSRNPGLAVGKVIAASNPDVEVLSTDDGAGTVTLRDKRNGKVVTLSFDQIRSGKFKFSAKDDEGKTANVEIGGDVKAPSWIPAYPGATVTPGVSAKGESEDGSGEGGSFMFVTSDPPQKVMSFYEDKAKELGMKANVAVRHGNGGTVVLADDDGERSLTILVGTGSDGTTVNVTYGRKR